MGGHGIDAVVQRAIQLVDNTNKWIGNVEAGKANANADQLRELFQRLRVMRLAINGVAEYGAMPRPKPTLLADLDGCVLAIEGMLNGSFDAREQKATQPPTADGVCPTCGRRP